MPGLENDPHPAGGDLFDQLELAEIGAGLDLEFRRHGLERPVRRIVAPVSIANEERARQPLEAVFVGEERPEVVGEIGVTRQKVRSIGRLAGVDGLEVAGDGLIQPLLLLGIASGR